MKNIDIMINHNQMMSDKLTDELSVVYKALDSKNQYKASHFGQQLVDAGEEMKRISSNFFDISNIFGDALIIDKQHMLDFIGFIEHHMQKIKGSESEKEQISCYIAEFVGQWIKTEPEDPAKPNLKQ